MELDTKSLEESQGPLEKIPCTGEVDPTEETHETFQGGCQGHCCLHCCFLAGCIIGVLAVYRGTSHITPLGNDEAPTSNPEPKPLSSAKSAKLAPSAESSNNGLETPSILKQILDYIRSVVREFFRRLLHGTPYQLA